MRSLKYLSAFLPIINSAYAGAGRGGNAGGDGTVIVTQTRTVTICPIEQFITTCDDIIETTYTSRSGAPKPTTTTSSKKDEETTTSKGGEDGTTTSKGGEDGTTTSKGGEDGTTTSKGGEDGTTTSKGGEGSTTSKGETTTSGASTSTTTGSETTTSSTTTTTSGCASTKTANPIADSICNKAGSRGKWCDSKSVDDDTHEDYRTGKTRTYNLVISDLAIDHDGTGAIAGFAINGKSPGDPIVANWGDEVQITVTNNMKGNATTIHWHGITQKGTNDQDGVPGVTECGIAPGSSRTYKWLASTYGTGWYHSHLLAQYGGGIRGPIIIHGPATSDYDLDMGTVMIDETFNTTIFDEAKIVAPVRGPLQQARNYLLNGKNTSPDATKGESARWIVKEGKKHLFRIINSSAQSAFLVHFDNHKMTVISADFTPIVPYTTDTLRIMGGQRYNVIVEADQPKGAYYLRAITQTLCGVTNVNNGLGVANGIIEYEGSCESVPALGNFTINAAVCEDEPLAGLVPHVNKDAGSQDAFLATAKNLPGGNVAQVNYAGVGNINRWFFGGEKDLYSTAVGDKFINVTFSQPTLQLLSTVGQPDSAIYSNAVVLNQTDSWVYWVIQNTFATSHPMHLHGHDFAVLGQNRGKVFTAADVASLNFVNPIRRDTVLLFGQGQGTANIPGYTVIGFKTDNPGAWVMHCHIIWHADAGMGMQFIERPNDISNYGSKADFQNECSALQAYEAQGPEKLKAPYEAGIKRHLEDHKFHGYSYGHAVRHA